MTEASPSRQAVLYLGIMVHLEGWSDGTSQARFEEHVAGMREYAALFEAYGAWLTWESKEVTEGVERWGDNVLAEMQQRGHGIGVHADIGGESDYDCDRFASDLRAEREQLGSLGVTVRHVSGIVSHCDWVTAAAEAGYQFTTGQVAYSVMSLPREFRPPQYRDCRSPAACHDVYPPDLADRIHPWRMDSGSDWLTHDPHGRLVMLPSSEVLSCMEESQAGARSGGCTFSAEDVDRSIQELEQAIALSEPDLVNTYYVSWSFGGPLDEELLEDWLGRIAAYVEAGQVQWMTLPQMVEEYIAWETSH